MSSAPDTRPWVRWRNGVHVLDTPLWCDAQRTAGVCFVSSARVAGARRHHQIIATEATGRLLARAGETREMLTVPYGRPFSLGALRLELFPSGHMVGGAQVVITTRRGRVAYAGAILPRPTCLGERAEVRKADALVLTATFGEARFRFPPREEVLAELLAWVRVQLAAGTTPVLLAEPLSVAPELVCALGQAVPVSAHRDIAVAVGKLRALGHDRLVKVRRYARAPAAGHVLLWPVGKRDAEALRLCTQGNSCKLALVSGWATDAEVVKRARVDAAFALADEGDSDDLSDYVAQVAAKHVYLVGGTATSRAELAARLREKHGVDVQWLGPPLQLPLFPAPLG